MERFRPYIPLSITALVAALIIVVFYILNSSLVSSQLVLTVATVTGGFFAIFLYIKRKVDRRHEAALIILAEVREAEEIISGIKDLLQVDASVTVQAVTSMGPLLSSDSWVKLKYLFVSDLDRDEFKHMSDFFKKSRAIDEALAQLDVGNQIQYKSRTYYDGLVSLAIYSKTDEDYLARKNNFLRRYMKDETTFIPDLPRSTLLNNVNSVRFVSSSTAFAKLKKIAKQS